MAKVELYQVLKMISAETALIGKAVQEGSATASSDQIQYLNAKLSKLRQKIELKSDGHSVILVDLADNIHESIEITRINQARLWPFFR